MAEPQDNWHKDRSTTPGYIREDQAAKYGDRFDGVVRGFIPDPNAKPDIVLTPEQEIFGMAGRPSNLTEERMLPVKRRDAGTLRPNGETRPMPKGTAVAPPPPVIDEEDDADPTEPLHSAPAP